MNNWVIYGIDLLIVVFEVYIFVYFFDGIWEKKNYPRWLKAMVIVVLVILLFGGSVFLKNTNWLLVIFCLTGVTLTFFYETSNLKRVYFVLVVTIIMAVNEVIVICILIWGNNLSLEIIQTNTFIYLIVACVSKFCLFFEITISIAFLKKNRKMISKEILLPLLFFPIASVFIILFLGAITLQLEMVEINIFTILVMGLLIPGNIIIFYIIEKQIKNQLDEQAHFFMKDQVVKQRKHYEEVLKSQSEVRRLWHDMKNHLLGISGFIKKDENEEALKMIEALLKESLSEDVKIYTKNLAVNAVINSKIKKGEEIGCQLSLKIDLPENPEVEGMDLAMVIGNLMDNAIEASEKLKKDDREIVLNLSTKGKSIFLFIENKVQKPMDVKKIETSKEDKKSHGIGLKSVKSIVEKYDGEIALNCKEDYFSVQVVFMKK